MAGRAAGKPALGEHAMVGDECMNSADSFLSRSQIYDPVAVLRRNSEVLVVDRVGKKASQHFMIVTPEGEPIWPHEPLGSLSDVAWALRAHEWHLTTPEPVGQNFRLAGSLARRLSERS
jgi:hypothetical protein